MAVRLIDTHCHIQFDDYALDPAEVVRAAAEEGVSRMICVGCRLSDSEAAIAMAKRFPDMVLASIGLHPHEGKDYVRDEHALQRFRQLAAAPEVVAIGETGLDYYYAHSPAEDQKKLLRFQLDVAAEFDLPLIFHVRDAFDDFFEIFDEYSTRTRLRGVVHSFSAGPAELARILERGLLVGVNGIMTFTKKDDQLAAARAIPLNKLVLETDAPFLTPYPFRGTICQPKHVRVTAEFMATLRGESLEEFAAATTRNAEALFDNRKRKL